MAGTCPRDLKRQAITPAWRAPCFIVAQSYSSPEKKLCDLGEPGVRCLDQNMNTIKYLGHFRSVALAAAGCLALFVWTATLVAAGDDQSIIAATKKYLAGESYTGETTIKVEKVEGDFARVLATPKDGRTDAALVFLKREKGVWRGLTIGTGFDPEDLAKLHIPPSLRP
jgi:hypothetical protein